MKRSGSTVPQQMTALLEQLAPHEGYTRSLLDSVRFMRSDQPLGRTPVLYEPSIEFKRFVGRPPGEELRQMKVAFSLLPPTQLEGIALAH